MISSLCCHWISCIFSTELNKPYSACLGSSSLVIFKNSSTDWVSILRYSSLDSNNFFSLHTLMSSYCRNIMVGGLILSSTFCHYYSFFQTPDPVDYSTLPGWWRPLFKCFTWSTSSLASTTGSQLTRVSRQTSLCMTGEGMPTSDVSTSPPRLPPPLARIPSPPTTWRDASWPAAGWRESSSSPF